jgi:hypothetical protein
MENHITGWHLAQSLVLFMQRLLHPLAKIQGFGKSLLDFMQASDGFWIQPTGIVSGYSLICVKHWILSWDKDQLLPGCGFHVTPMRCTAVRHFVFHFLRPLFFRLVKQNRLQDDLNITFA